jgi:hypothetical protein
VRKKTPTAYALHVHATDWQGVKVIGVVSNLDARTSAQQSPLSIVQNKSEIKPDESM